MAILNQVATQIAVKRLSGKAQVSALLSLSQEAKGSTVQTLSSTVFGELVPNTPTTESADLYVVQSASLSDPGTVMLAEFAIYPLAGTSKYQNVINGGVGTGVDELDTGENSIDTYHAYALYISGGAAGFEASATANGFDTYASTTTALGTGQFQDGFYLTGSGKLQIVPEFASVDNFTAAYPYNNKYTPIIRSTDGSIIQPNSGIDWYLDPYAGILFIQDPEDYGTNYNTTTGASQNSGPEIPSKITAFLYVGKYQDEVTFTSGDVNFKVSGSDDGFDVGNSDTINFVSGSAGITVESNGSPGTITIGESTDNITVNQITASIINADTIEVSEFIVSSSVTYMTQSFSSGSTIFGDTNDDTHQFTGSLYVLHTGSDYGITLTGSGLTIDSGDGASISASGFISASDLYLTNTLTALDGGVTVTTNDSVELYVGGNITASGDISASGLLFASASDDNGAVTTMAVAMYDTVSGRFYYTGSEALGDTTQLEASASAGIHVSASAGTGFSIGLVQSASFITGSTSGDGLTITAGAGNTITYTLVGVLSSSQQIATDISGAIDAATGSLLNTYTFLSSSQQIATDISGAIDAATGSLLNTYTFLSSSQQIATDISGAIDAATASFSESIVGTANEVEVTNGGTPGNIIIGLPDDVIIAGNLTVNGTTTTIDTTNLQVEDSFIHLASGSGTSGNGGIIIERATDNTGTALFWDETNGVWAVDLAGASAPNNTATADANIVFVSHSSANPTGNPLMGATADYQYGQMYIATTDNDNDGNNIWIYA